MDKVRAFVDTLNLGDKVDELVDTKLGLVDKLPRLVDKKSTFEDTLKIKLKN